MTNWKNGRPEGWENPHMSGDPFTGEILPSTKSEIYEAGADAMLRAVVEYVDDIVEYYACGLCDNDYHITDKKKWKALLKEAGG